MKKLVSICLLLFIWTVSLQAESPAAVKSKAENNYQQGKELYDKKEYKKAYHFLLQAANAGHSEAQMHLGKMFYNGWGVPHSHEKGKMWHEKAAAQGNKESQAKLKKMDHH